MGLGISSINMGQALDPYSVKTTGDQSISGIKIFLDNTIHRSGIKIGELSEPSNPIIEFFDGANGDYNELTWSDSTLSFRNYPDGSGNLGGNAQLIFNFAAIESNGIGTIALDERVVHNFGDETISGLKDFATRPTVNTVPVALSGESASSIEQIIKNGYGATLYKAQPVYVSGSNGNNILVNLASNLGDGTSSKTFGLLKQTLLDNEQGYVVTEGPLFNVDTSMAVEGDPIWLGTTGNLIYGFANKPKAPEHIVSLGFVERAHQNQGKIFVKVQNGFEIDELHDVRIVNKQNSDIIIYNSGSGLWLNSGVNFENFYTKNNPSGFITNENVVFTTGDQIISGNKSFAASKYIFSGANVVFINNTGISSGQWEFYNRPTVNGSGVLLIGEAQALPSTLVYTTGNQTISGLKNFATRPTVNGVGVLLSGEAANFASDIGIYNYKANINYDNQYLKQENVLNSQELNSPVSGIKNDDIVNLYFSDYTVSVDNGVKTTYSKTLKVNPGVLVDHNGATSSRNLIKFDDTTQYSGKAIRKVRYNSTVGNGYERILLSVDSNDTNNCPIIRPKTRRLETFYDISVPSGGGGRVFLFRTPTSFPFVQGTCMNLRFSFEADNSPCVISGLVYGTNEHVLTLSGANYSFVQKERVILISKGGDGSTAEFKHW